MNQNMNLVHTWLSHGASISARAIGLAFQHSPHNLIHYGEHQGNIVLHIFILQPNKTFACQMYDLLLSYDVGDHFQCLELVPNHQSFTPFKMAEMEGITVMFQHLVQKSKHIQRSPGLLNFYDITKLTSEFVISSKKTRGSQESKTVKELVKELVSLKWKMYGWPYFRILFGLYIFYMTGFTKYYIYCHVKFCDGSCTNSRGNIIFQQ
ncbi:transient receptor potential cation channel subfamily V member 5-like [Cavia porcellus]|uniref:transient receptor potential cation channel subfamily V member 5-like n=1 Tax=Cavia porcellus TaxID=10141 RepID=UPI002FE24B8C